MPQSPETILKELKNSRYAPIYFLQGEEPYYIDLISNYIEAHALKPQEKGFNQMIMYGQDAPVSAILSNARRFPMMSERQVVIIKEAQEIPDLGKEDAVKLLDSYFKNPLPSTILVFNHKYKKISKKSLSDTIEKYTVSVESKKLYDNQLPDWITEMVKTKGFSIAHKASLMLADNIGNNLERLANEVDKLLINYKEKTEITPEAVHRYVGISKEYNVFELQKALIFKDPLKANSIVNYFDANPKSNPIIPIIASLYTYFSKLLIVHHSKDKSEKALASQLRINPFFVKDYVAGMKNYSQEKVFNIIHFLKLADLQSKGVDSPSLSEGQILKELVFKILH